MKEETTACEGEIPIPDFSGALNSSAPIIQVKNNLYLYGEIDDTLAKSLIAALHELAMKNIGISIDNDVQIAPIKIIINSPGGQVSSALGIVAAIEDIQKGKIHKVDGKPIPVTVNTEIQGEADSAASLIACVGNHRTISKYSFSLIHDPRAYGGAGGKAEDYEDSSYNMNMIKKMLHDIYLNHSKLSEEQLSELAKTERYSSPEKLLSFGIVDEIV